VVAGNGNGGVFFNGNDTVRDFLIKDSSIGAAPDGMGSTFAGNGFSGFDADASQFFGVEFLNSFFNGNGTAGAGLATASSLSRAARSRRARSRSTIQARRSPPV
jgi:hypothetical protein